MAKEELQLLAKAVDKGQASLADLVVLANKQGHDISYSTAYQRLRNGDSALEAVTAPPRSKRSFVIRFRNGKTMPVQEAEKVYGVPYQTIATRKRNHPDWPGEKLVRKKHYPRGNRHAASR